MRARAAGLAVGIVFGFMLSWSRMADPDVIRNALLFRDSYLFLFMASAVGTAAIGLRLLRGRGRPAPRERIERRHITGALVFGSGWGLANVCPGPIAAQLGQGIAWSLPIAAGAFAGVYAYLRRHSTETEPASDGRPAAASRGRQPRFSL